MVVKPLSCCISLVWGSQGCVVIISSFITPRACARVWRFCKVSLLELGVLGRQAVPRPLALHSLMVKRTSGNDTATSFTVDFGSNV